MKKGILIFAILILCAGCSKPEINAEPEKDEYRNTSKLICEYPRITEADVKELAAMSAPESKQEDEEIVIEEPEIVEPEEEIIEEEIEEDIEEGIQMTDESEADGWVYMGNYQITAYEETGNPCANGNYPTIGYTAACNSLPFGTTVYIEGIGYRTIEDRGAEWHSDQWIDVYMGYVWDCNQFGVQYLDVWVVE